MSEQITMEKSELEKVIDSKTQAKMNAMKAEWEAKSADEKAELSKANDAAIAKAVAKSEANRKSVEDTGYQLDGSKANKEMTLTSIIEKSEKQGSRMSDFDKDFQKSSDELALLNNIYGKDNSKGTDEILSTKCFKRYSSLVKKMANEKSYDEGATTGAEWLPTYLSNRMIELVENANDFTIANLFERINMTSKVFEIPRSEGHPVAYLGSIGGTPAGSGAGDTTGKATFTAKKIIGWTKTAYEQDEDQTIALIPYIERTLSERIAKGISDAIINGDTSATHMNANVTTSTDRRKAWNGLTKIAQDNSYTKSVGAIWSTTLLRKVEAQIDLEFQDFDMLKLILGADGYTQLRNLAEVTTVDKIGNMATILNGKMTQIDGMDVIKTSLINEAVTAAGVVSGTTASNTKGQALIVNPKAFALGVRRSLLLESDRNIKTQEIDIVASMRADFQSLILASGQKAVVQAINVTKF